MKETEIGIERSSGNVYADLGFPDAAEMLVKAQLVAKISEILASRKWTQQKASKVLGIPQPKLSKMLRGQFHGISQTKMLECLTRLGRDIQILISPEKSASPMGRVEVVSA
jgi:predicted XRE-type DNA-binding protein